MMREGLRTLIVAALAAITGSAAAQAIGTLRVTVFLIDAEQKLTPVPRHALLVSDNPPTAAPRRILTSLDGTVSVRLSPGKYTVESDRPVALNGKAYQWTAMVDVAADREVTLELTAENAEVDTAAATVTTTAAPLENDPSFLLNQWRDSVVAVWTPTTRVSGVLVDSNGLVVTSRRGIGAGTSVEVQLTPLVKVAARVVATDLERDVALLRIDPSVIAGVRPLALDCVQAAEPTIADDQDLFTIGAPIRGEKQLTPGRVSRVQSDIRADFGLVSSAAGGPVFTAAGVVVGISATLDEDREVRQRDFRVVRVAHLCEGVRSADANMRTVPPSGAHLPVESLRSFPRDVLDAAAERLAGISIPYQMAASDFDISLVTPVQVHAAARRWKQAGAAARNAGPIPLDAGAQRIRLLTDYGHWSDYFEPFPPVLVVRVTPKLEESFWMKVARGAASTQGMALPPIKRLTSGFLRLRAYCGTAEVTPIQPFKLAHRVSEKDTIHEGLHVFDPNALGPHCGTVRLMVYSEKEPEKADTRPVDPKLLQQVWDDFAPFRALPPLGPG